MVSVLLPVFLTMLSIFPQSNDDVLGKLANNMPSKETIVTAINAYIVMMEKMVDAPEFAELVTPESMKALLAQIPGISAYPEVANMLNSDEFSDPEVLKQTMLEGIKAFKDGTDQLAELLSDPLQISALLEQLPAEARSIINSVLSGDMSTLKNMISQVPGLASSQKKLLTSMLDGANPDALQENVQEILSDPDQVETARQQMLANPGKQSTTSRHACTQYFISSPHIITFNAWTYIFVNLCIYTFMNRIGNDV